MWFFFRLKTLTPPLKRGSTSSFSHFREPCFCCLCCTHVIINRVSLCVRFLHSSAVWHHCRQFTSRLFLDNFSRQRPGATKKEKHDGTRNLVPLPLQNWNHPAVFKKNCSHYFTSISLAFVILPAVLCQ